jgi:hypothetical protein
VATKLDSVLNPEGHRTIIPDGRPRQLDGPSSSTLAPRLDGLDGKTVYLVDTGFGGSDKFLDEMQAWFSERMPAVKTVRRRKSGNVFRDDSKELWDEIGAQGQAAVLGVAG